jgi:hypothetical protein
MRQRFLGRARCVIVLSLVAIVGLECGKGGQVVPSPSEWMRVIVTFHVQTFETDEQRGRAIVAARQALLAELKSTPHRVTRMYETVPAIALEASSEALLVLRRSQLVAGIEEDRVVGPQ